MMRVLHIGKFYPPFAGGMENFLADLIAAQRQSGIDAAALIHAHEKKTGNTDFAADPPPYENIYRVPSYGRLLYAPVSPSFPFWLERVIKRFKPQVLHLHMPNLSVFWALFSPAARRLPWLVHWHADVIALPWEKRLALAYRLYRPFEQAVLKRSRAIIVTSPPYLESSSALRPWRGKCHVVPLGIASSRLPAPSGEAAAWAERQWGKGLRILGVGRLTYYKGFDTLIRAAQKLDAVSVIIAGRGEQREPLQALIKDLALENKVQLAGFCDEDALAALFNSCGCFCLPSLERTEAFGVVLLEAMYYARPAVLSKIPGSGVSWVMENEVHGLHVPPAEPNKLAAALRGLQREPALRRRLGENGRRRFMESFLIERVAERITELYKTFG